jgi:hypothetical protein
MFFFWVCNLCCSTFMYLLICLVVTISDTAVPCGPNYLTV